MENNTAAGHDIYCNTNEKFILINKRSSLLIRQKYSFRGMEYILDWK